GVGPCGAAAPRPASPPPLPAGEVTAVGWPPRAGACEPDCCCAATVRTAAMMAIAAKPTRCFRTAALLFLVLRTRPPERGKWRRSLLLRPAVACRAPKPAAPVGKRHAPGIRHVRAVLRHRAFDRDRVADLQGVPRPSLAHQHVGARELEIPVRDRAF